MNDSKKISDHVRQIVAEVCLIDVSEVLASDTLDELGDFEDIVEVVTICEKEFGVELNDEEEFTTVQELVNLLEEKRDRT